MGKWQRGNKYNVSPANQRSYKGRTYDSKAEMLYCQRLDLLIKSGDVLDYCEQPKVLICGTLWYKPDFFVIEERDAYYVDVKGVETQEFVKIKKAWPSRVGFRLDVVKRKKDSFFVSESIPGANR